MTAIDHRAEMDDALSVAKGARGTALAAEKIALAGVHATALLVEQQRIANRIALEAVQPTSSSSGGYTLRELMPNETINSIDEALGTFA